VRESTRRWAKSNRSHEARDCAELADVVNENDRAIRLAAIARPTTVMQAPVKE
jgi:hypothetical protein